MAEVPRLDAQIGFLTEACNLKTVERANLLQSGARPENSAEHSWHLALWALVFGEDAPRGVCVDSAIAMLLLHDLVEIDAGDHPIHLAADPAEIAAKETAAAARLFGLLPPEQGRVFRALWQEFEAATTETARFARRLDVAQPMFQVLQGTAPAFHHDIVRDNLKSGRALPLANTWPDLYHHATALLDGAESAVTHTSPLGQQLRFLAEADLLKSTLRATQICAGTRRENSGEHSWHIALYALVLAEHSNRPINAARVIRMLLIHDLVEIDVGDVPIHAQNGTAHGGAEVQAAEARAADRIFGLLPPAQGATLRALWEEFEAAETDDAIFAKSIDRVQPVISNLETGGGTWPEYEVTLAQLDIRVGQKVCHGAPDVWTAIRPRVEVWFAAR